MLEKGVHPDVVQAIMRHSNIAITLEVYNHINQNRKFEAFKVLNDYYKITAELRKSNSTFEKFESFYPLNLEKMLHYI